MDQENNFAFGGVSGKPLEEGGGGIAMEGFEFFCEFACDAAIGEGRLEVENF